MRRAADMPGILPLKIISSMATRELLSELVQQYRHESAVAVTASAAGGVDVAKRVSAGEQFDVVVLASNVIDSLASAGHVLAGSRSDLARSGIAVAVRAGALRPDITTEQAVRDAVLAATAISFSTGPSGVHLEKLLAGWGILAQVRDRIVTAPPGIPVGSLVADGRVDLGFQQLSELMALPGIDVVGPLPPAIQQMTMFSGGIVANSDQPEAARALLDYLAAPRTAAVKRRYGMDAP